MVNSLDKLPYRVFNLRVKDKIKEEASMGCYNKWKIKDKEHYLWVKSGDYIFNNYNHEGVMEVVTSSLAKELGIKDVVQYYPCVLNIEELDGTISHSIGCYSYQFTAENEEVVSFDDLGENCKNYEVLIRNVARKTNISTEDIRDYIDRCLLIDSLVLNGDRHLGNLAVIKNQSTGKYRLCPVFDFGLALHGLATSPTEIQKFSDYELTEYRAKPFSESHDAQLELTHYKDNIDGKIELLHMIENNTINNTMNHINRMFACFGYDYLSNWNSEQREKADKFRRLYKIEFPMLLGERYYLISAIKRRMEVVLAGKTMPYRMCQENIDRETELIEYMRYKCI